jgi:hypothetical protein
MVISTKEGDLIMKKPTYLTITALALLSFSHLASAQPPSPAYQPQPMMQRDNMPHAMRYPDFQRPERPSQFMPAFPSPEELSRIAPPEPMTEEKIKQRFAKQKEDLQANLDRDRKAAEKYAADFARFQKYQADRLTEIMARAEERRGQMLQRLEEREKRVLLQFREQQAAENADSKKEEI